MFLVKVISHETGEVVKTLTAKSERMADKLDSGVNINLNHEKYYTNIEEAKENNVFECEIVFKPKEQTNDR